MPEKERPAWLRISLKALLAFHVIAIVSWTLPPAPQAVKVGLVPARGVDAALQFNDTWVRMSPTHEYFLDFGVWQSWDMFAPNPSDRDVWADAEVVYRNGVVKTWKFPRMKTMDLFTKFSMERWRKYFERTNVDDFAYLRPALCEWIARQYDREPGNPPVLVRLFRNLRITPPTVTFKEYLDGGIFRLPPNPANDAPYDRTLLIEYQIEPEMLK